jgi:hypothetical protein
VDHCGCVCLDIADPVGPRTLVQDDGDGVVVDECHDQGPVAGA